MNKYNLLADNCVLFHQHILFDYRNKFEEGLRAISGVFSVHFDAYEYWNAMIVVYSQKAVSSDVLLEIIRKSYVIAVKVAGLLTRVRSK